MIMGGVTSPSQHVVSCSNDYKAPSEGTRAVSLLKRREKQRKELEQQKISEVLVLLIRTSLQITMTTLTCTSSITV